MPEIFEQQGLCFSKAFCTVGVHLNTTKQGFECNRNPVSITSRVLPEPFRISFRLGAILRPNRELKEISTCESHILKAAEIVPSRGLYKILVRQQRFCPQTVQCVRLIAVGYRDSQ